MSKNDRSDINPFTGKKHFNILNDDKFLDDSYKEYNKTINQSKLLDDTPDGQILRDTSLKLIDAVEKHLLEIGRSDYTANYYDWEFHLVTNDVANAFCMPGGKILVYSGILSVTKDEKSLAFILAHEMAHALLDHSRGQVSAHTTKNTVTTAARLGSIGLDLLGLGDVASVVTTATNVADIGSEYLLLKPWGRNHEMEADKLGMMITNWAGYDITEISEFWKRMSETNSNKHDFFSTHPSDNKRIAGMNKLVLEIVNQESSINRPALSKPQKQKQSFNMPTLPKLHSQEGSVITSALSISSDEKNVKQNDSKKYNIIKKEQFTSKNLNRFCTNCGNPIKEDYKFCTNCGNQVKI